MNTISQNNQQSSPSLARIGAGIGAGVLANHVICKHAVKALTKYPINQCSKLNQSIDHNIIKSGSQNILLYTGLKDKGVIINDYSNSSYQKDYDTQIKEANEKIKQLRKDKSINFKDRLKQIRQLRKKIKINKGTAKLVKGEAAFYSTTTNKINLNLEKRSLSFFHELGHAINKNQTKFWKTVQGLRKHCIKASVLIPIVGLLIPPKRTEEKPSGFFNKTTSFIRNNIGVLTAMTYVPIIAEEIKASANGNVVALRYFGKSNNICKKIFKSNCFAGSTYIIAAILAGIGAWAAVKVRDKIAPPLKEN